MRKAVGSIITRNVIDVARISASRTRQYVVRFGKPAAGVLILASVLLLTLISASPPRHAAPAPGKHWAGPADILKNCPPGYRIEFVLPTATLYVDPHLLGSTTLIDLWDWVSGPTCPTWPVEINDIYLGGGILDAMEIQTGLGRKLNRIWIGAHPGGRQAIPPSETSDQYAREPWIEFIPNPANDKDYEKPGLKYSRHYIMHFPDVGAGTERRSVVICNGRVETGGRQCGIGRNDGYDGVQIYYDLSQDKLPIADAASIDPSTEPGALLQFEIRLRALIDQFKRPP